MGYVFMEEDDREMDGMGRGELLSDGVGFQFGKLKTVLEMDDDDVYKII